MKYILSLVVLLCLISSASFAEEIIWSQPAQTPAYSQAPAYHENLNFEGNAALRKSDARKLQKALAAKGFYKGKIDGIWGAQTTQAILDYQAVNEQALTGTVTVGTLRDLGVYVNEKNYQ
jgi:peptidoglycan hydrolase-like protein with peptidoglycan-binding domain